MLEGSGTRTLGGRDPLRACQRILSWLIVALFVSIFPSRAHAYAWMIKHGYSGCPVCHADPSGGELLTAYGRAQSDLLLRMRYGAPGGGSVAPSSSSSSSSFDSFDSDDDSSDKAKAPAKSDAKPSSNDDKTDANSGDDDDADDDKPAAAAKPADGAKPAEATKPATADDSPKTDDDGSLSKSSGYLWGLVTPPDWLLLGGSYRHLTVYKPGSNYFTTFPMMADLYGQIQIGKFRVEASVGAVRVGVGSPYARAAQITTGQGDQWNLLSRTHWIGYDLADGQVTVRAGHLNLPFGVRIPEHTMWVRQATRTDRESAQQDGVSISYNGEKLRGEAMAIAGNYQISPDRYRERGYSLFAEYMTGARTAVGISSLLTKVKEDRITLKPDVLRSAHGIFVRSALSDKVVILAEGDMLTHSKADTGYVAFAQLDFEATQGLHFMGTVEALDTGYDHQADRAVGNGKPDLGVWGTIDWFCLPHVEIRADVLSRQDDVVTFLGQLHVFL